MSRLLLPSVLFVVACGEKKAPEPAPVAAAPAAVEAAPAPAEPEPAPEPVELNNADLNVKITLADGSSKAGHVKRIERSSNFRGDEDWLTEAGDLKIPAEGAGSYKKFDWSQVKSVAVKPETPSSSNISCSYSSEVNPWVYECTLPAPASLSAKEGGTFTVDSGYKWRFVFDDDSAVEFYMKKHIVWEQDAEEVGLETENPENYELYGKLQQRLKTEVKSSALVVKVEVQ